MPNPVDLSAEEETQLAKDDPELLKEVGRRREREMELQYPPLTVADVRKAYDTLRRTWEAHHAQMQVQRQVRYLRDQTPEKWARHLETDRRVRTRLSHNEVIRVSANQARNPFKVKQKPAGKTADAVKRARKQERWQQEFWSAMERASALPLRRRWVDQQNGDSMGCYEFFLTGAYEDADLDQHEDEDDKTYLERTDEEILGLGEAAAFGVRVLDPMSVYPDLVEGVRPRKGKGSANPGVKRVVIAERKNYRDVLVDLMDRKGIDALEELRMPKPEDRGWPAEYGQTWGVGSEDTSDQVLPNDASGEVEVIRYYDGCWYVEIVGGKEVVNEKHGLPGVPVFCGFATVTGSSFLSEAIQGVTWGMLDLELAANDLLTYKLDATITYGRPAPGIKTAVGGQIMRDARSKEPVSLDLSDISKVKQLAEGQEPFDWFEGFRSRIDDSDVASLIGLWERNGLNPIAQGQSPGADAAGYTVNSLMGATLAAYEESIENEEKVIACMMDFARLTIRDTIKEKVFLSVPMEDAKVGGVEWLGLGPDDIDETPVQVTVDPQSDANRLARQQALLSALAAKLISRARVQREGFNIEDTESEDLEIIGDAAMERLVPVLLENVFTRVRIPPPMPAGGGDQSRQLVGPDGVTPISSANGAGPAEPQPPSVGKETSAATQGFTSRARGGQDSGYAPPPGPLNKGAA